MDITYITGVVNETEYLTEYYHVEYAIAIKIQIAELIHISEYFIFVYSHI